MSLFAEIEQAAEKLCWYARTLMVRTCGTPGEHSRRMLKRPDFSPAQPWRAETRLVPGKAATPRLPLVSRLTFHGSWERCENAAGEIFKHSARNHNERTLACQGRQG